MKSLMYSIYLIIDGIGSYVAALLIVIVNSWNPQWIPNDLNDGYLEYFFFVLAILLAFNLILFVIVAENYNYRYRKRPLEQLPLLARITSPPPDDPQAQRYSQSSFIENDKKSVVYGDHDMSYYKKSLCYRLKCW